MATRRTDVRRGGIDLSTIVSDPSMIEDGKLVFPSGNLTPTQINFLQLLMDSIQVLEDSDEYIITPSTNLKTSLGSDAFRFKHLRVSDSSIYIGDNKLSFENNNLKVYQVATDGTETPTSILSIDEIKTSLISDDTSEGLIQQVVEQVSSGADGNSIVFKGQVSTDPSGSGTVDAISNGQSISFNPILGHSVLNSTSGEIFFYDDTDWISGGSIKGSDGSPGVSPTASDVAADTALQTEISTLLANNEAFQDEVKGQAGAPGQDGVPLDILIVSSDSTLTASHSNAPIGTIAIADSYYHDSGETVYNAIFKKVSEYLSSTDDGWEYQYQSLKGDQGPRGEEGPQGNTLQWYFVSSVSELSTSPYNTYPNGTIAVVDDDGSLQNVIYVKQSGSWETTNQSLKGQDGNSAPTLTQVVDQLIADHTDDLKGDPGAPADNAAIATTLAGQTAFQTSVAAQSALASNVSTLLAGTDSFVQATKGEDGQTPIAKTFTVTVQDSKFYIDNVEKPALTLFKGQTYLFDYSDVPPAHPFQIQTASGSEITQGLSDLNNIITYQVPQSLTEDLKYVCTEHLNMGNDISVYTLIPSDLIGPQGETGLVGPEGPTGPKGDKFSVDISATLNKANASAAQQQQVQSYFYVVTVDQRDVDPFDLINDLNDPNSFISGDLSGHLLMWSYQDQASNGINGYWTDLGKMAGVKGDQGDQGPAGPQGPVGGQGDQGPPGTPADDDAIAQTLITSSTFQNFVASSSVKTLGAGLDTSNAVFTSWDANTSLSTAINGFNQVLSNLTPKKAPGLSEGNEYLNSTTSGVSGNLSVQESMSSSTHTLVDKDGLYQPSSPSSNNSYSTRIGIIDGTTDIQGKLNSSVVASGNSYPNEAFSDAALGYLKLYINGVEETGATVSLSSTPNATTLLSNQSGFQLSEISNAKYENGSDFDFFNYRTGTYIVRSDNSKLVEGWNFIQIKHDLDNGTIRESEIIEFYRDTNTESITSLTDNLTPSFNSTTRSISGIKYFTSGDLVYSATLNNVYKNTYSDSGSAINYIVNNNLSDPSSHSIPPLGNQDKDSPLSLSQTVNIKNNHIICDGDLTVSVRLQHPVKGTVTVGTQTVSNVLFNNKTETTNDAVLDLLENFEGERKRILYQDSASAYDYQDDIDSLSFISSADLSSSQELVIFNENLIYGKQDYNFDNGPLANANYSSFSGQKYYLRKFVNTTSSISQNFSIKLTGDFTLKAANSASFSAKDIRVFIKVPMSNNDNSALGTGWMDAYSASPSVPTWFDDEGMRAGTISTSSNSSTIPLTMGTRYIPSSEAILVKIQAPDSWSGSISQIQIIWG